MYSTIPQLENIYSVINAFINHILLTCEEHHVELMNDIVKLLVCRGRKKDIDMEFARKRGKSISSVIFDNSGVCNDCIIHKIELASYHGRKVRISRRDRTSTSVILSIKAEGYDDPIYEDKIDLVSDHTPSP